MTKQKRWFFATLFGSAAALILILTAMVLVDPYFHYHGKLPGISYRIYNERYINDGIVRNFEYDAIITGTSMTQNFKTSQMDELFGTNSIKTSFSGAGFQEISKNLDAAFTGDNEIKLVLIGLEHNGLYREHYWKGYQDYPEYLYDDKLLNDVSYVWNKELIFQGLVTALLQTLQGEETTSFDDYSAWENGRGWESISKTYQRSEEILPMKQTEGMEAEIEVVEDNLLKNYIRVIKEHPETKFVLFYTPFSALYWEDLYREGKLEQQLLFEETATKLLLECENVELYSFAKETDITENIDLYRDKEHYVWEVNEMILQWIAEGKGRVTRENYQELIQWERDYYTNFDYDRLYE